MNLRDNPAGRMEYIQKLFLDVERFVEVNNELDVVLTMLDKEPPEFRSVAYESASMVFAAKDLNDKQELNNWKDFKLAGSGHSFHIDIGLGWAIAKRGIRMNDFLNSLDPAAKRMVVDGMGYYYALFKGRATLKDKIVPGDIEDIHGFDQGVGRRLWYTVEGSVDRLLGLLQDFPAARHPDLWRGTGIACGYVGGSKEESLEYLSYVAKEHKEQLESGITLAAMSRIASNSVNEDIKIAYYIVCKKAFEELSRGNKAGNELLSL